MHLLIVFIVLFIVLFMLGIFNIDLNSFEYLLKL